LGGIPDERDDEAAAVHVENVNDDLNDLVQQTHVAGVLAEKLPLDPSAEIEVDVAPSWLRAEPFVDSVDVTLSVAGGEMSYGKSFRSGRWIRRAGLRLVELRSQGQLGQEETAYRSLVATASKDHGSNGHGSNGHGSNGHEVALRPPAIEIPPIEDRTLEELGIRRLTSGTLAAHRPILVNRQFERDVIERTRDTGLTETGGAVLGRYVRLPQALPETETRIVTVLSASVCDARHEGTSAQWHISPDALAEAAELAEISGQRVMTVWHSHPFCDKACEKRDTCQAVVIPAFFSNEDCQMAEMLFPSRASIFPVSGKTAVGQTDPLLVIHGWDDGLKPVPWRRYED